MENSYPSKSMISMELLCAHITTKLTLVSQIKKRFLCACMRVYVWENAPLGASPWRVEEGVRFPSSCELSNVWVLGTKLHNLASATS